MKSLHRAFCCPVETLRVDEATFESEVLHSHCPVLVDFWTESRTLGPVLAEIARTLFGRVKIAHVNVSESRELARRYRIQLSSTLLYFVDGEIRDKTVGLLPKQTLLNKVRTLIPRRTDPNRSGRIARALKLAGGVNPAVPACLFLRPDPMGLLPWRFDLSNPLQR